MKRAMDLFLTLFFAPLWLPLLAFTALIVLVIDGKPICFRQQRAGQGGKPFVLLKLRTMRDGEGTDRERVTPLGRLLRATSLDELPQLLQVLSGTMSLVGPRPLPTAYLPRYSTEQARRHEVRPGITGWAQVNGRNAISWEKKFQLDVWYVNHHTLILDLKILLLTVIRVFTRTGINVSAAETMPEFK